MAWPAVVAGCGGGAGGPDPAPGQARIDSFTSDKPRYAVGDRPVLTAVFSGGNGFVEPGHIGVKSGVPVTLGPLAATTPFRLLVSDGSGGHATRELTLDTAYSNTFRTLQAGAARAAHTASLLPDGRVLMMGGEDNGNALPASVLAFDWRQESFSLLGELTTGRVEHTATALADGTVLVVGGLRGLAQSPVAERFDPATRQSRATAVQPASNRRFHTATLLTDGRVLLAGGQSSGTTQFMDAVDVFDPATDRFARLPVRLAVPRIGHSAVLVTPHLLLLYGGTAAGGGAAAPELMDLGAQESNPLAPPPFETGARNHAATVRTAAGDTLVLGGEGVDDAPLATVARVLGGGLSLADGGKLAGPRARLAAAALADGRVLVTGGNATVTSRALATTEFYSPTQRASTPGPDLAAARFNHTATALPNGRVLVFGGNGAGNGVLASAELFS